MKNTEVLNCNFSQCGHPHKGIYRKDKEINNANTESDNKKHKAAIPWSEKTLKQKAGTVGAVPGIFCACTLVAYAIGQLWGQKSGTINNTKGAVFEMDLSALPEGVEVVPGTEQSLNSIAVQNKSSTENVYAFIGFSYDSDVYDIKDISGWEFVENSGDQVGYSYSSGGSMTPVDINGSATFTGTLECVADNTTFQALTDDDFVVDVTGYAISTSICSEGNTAAWTDYQNGGTQ